ALAVLAPGVAGADLDEQLHDPVCPTALRRAAAQALGGLADDRALDALVRAVGADDREVRLTAMIAIGEIAASDRAAAGRARDALVATLRGHIVAAPEPADAVAPPAGPAADDADEGAATISGGAEPEAADAPDAPAAWPTSTLEAILGDDGRSRPAQDDAVALSPDELDLLSLAGGAVGKRRVSPTSTVAKHLDVRHFAARLLGDLAGDDGVAGALAAALDDRDVDTRRAAADSLARLARLPAGLGVASVAALTAALADADRDVRLAAVRAVGLAGGRETEAALAACLDDVDRAVRAQAVRSLGRLCDDDRDIRARLDDDDPAIRLAAATALAARSPPDTVDRLCDFAMAFEGYQRLEAARLARPIDAAAASRRFLAVLRDPADRRGWLIAVEALTELHRRPGTG
ncbi:MAG: HEAT repeat domain-containing protein, partial [Alphaproteobacteria bacterium]